MNLQVITKKHHLFSLLNGAIYKGNDDMLENNGGSKKDKRDRITTFAWV